MKMDDIRAALADGVMVAVAFPQQESGAGRFGGDPVVKATIVEAPIEVRAGYGGGTKKGARCRLEEPLRVVRVRDSVERFEELPVGYGFDVESRLVDHVWGRSGVTRGAPADDERAAERAERYREQDAIREAFARLGLEESSGRFVSAGFRLNGGEVVVPRAELARWLRRIDPVSIVAEAIDEYVRETEDVLQLDTVQHREAKTKVLVEVEQGLAVSEVELVVEDRRLDKIISTNRVA